MCVICECLWWHWLSNVVVVFALKLKLAESFPEYHLNISLSSPLWCWKDACLALEVEAAATEMHGSKDAARLLYQRALKRCRATSQRLGWERFLRAILKRSPGDVWHLKYNLIIWLYFIDVLYDCIAFRPFAFASFGSWMFAPWTPLGNGNLWASNLASPDQYEQHWYSVETTCRLHLRRVILVTLVNIKDRVRWIQWHQWETPSKFHTVKLRIQVRLKVAEKAMPGAT